MQRTEKTAQEYKAEAKSAKQEVKKIREDKMKLGLELENYSLRLNKILKDVGCSDFSDYVKLSKQGFQIVVTKPDQGEHKCYKFPDEVLEPASRKFSG